MIYRNGVNAFGFWRGMPYQIETDKFEDFQGYHNSISKVAVIKHIESLSADYATTFSVDRFTGEHFGAGLYHDDPFKFPVDFLRYYKEYDIGIPLEYEEYLRSRI